MRKVSLEMQNLWKSFGQKKVLQGVSFSLYQGEILGLFGVSGTGKSVILRTIIGLESLDRGKIFFEGRNVVGLSERELLKIRTQISYVFQNGALFDSLTVEENLAYPLKEHTLLSKEEIHQKVNARLTQMDMSGCNDFYPNELSGGMQKRVGVARAIILDPQVILFDEPTTGLDPILVRSIHHLIADTQAHFHYTAVIVSHEIPQIFDIATRVAMLHQGVILEVETAARFQCSSNPAVQQFIAGRLEGPLTPT